MMPLPVVTVASGGLAVIDTGGGGPLGLPVTEAANKFGLAVTKVAAGKPGLGVVYVNASGAVVPPVPPFTASTWNAADKVATNLTNGNLTATSSGSAGSGRASPGYSAGKFYWEFTFVNVSQTTTSAGFGSTGAALPINVTSAGGTGLGGGGAITVGGVNQGSVGVRANGDVIGVAVDLTANLIWYRVAPVGTWNNSGTANPATGVGGLSISALTKPLVPTFYLSTVTGQALTANFGASAFTGAVPSGFTAGWGT
jgi:hypothetical protein